MSNRIVVIGGGASGMVAAIAASQRGSRVTIFEKNQRLGKKILATGNGRCNYTNVTMTKNCYNHPFFVESIFDQFSLDQTLEFFKDLGIYPRVEKEGKAYPTSLQARSITEALEREIHRLKIQVLHGQTVEEIEFKGDSFVVKTNQRQTNVFDKVIIATGGLALPKSGSDGSGYGFAEAFGHEVTPVFPALVKLNLDCPYLKETDGVKMETTVRLYQENKLVLEKTNDVLFTKYGVSGPTILDLSRKANELLLKQKRVFVSINLVPDYDKELLIERFMRLKQLSVYESMKGLLHQKLIHPVLKEAKINDKTIVEKLPINELERLISVLSDYRFEVLSSKDFDEAQVTAGGIKVNQVDQVTLESNLIPGLYFCGEVLDIDGLCGGYNLQWAWSSGFVAGRFASKMN